jgi:hypothetical protein
VKAATIYECEGRLFFHSSSRTDAGVWVANGPFLAASKEHVGEVGRAVRACLAGSSNGVPHPKSFATNLFEPVLNLAGVKSWGTFVKSAKCVEIETTNDTVATLIPTRNEGAKEGFFPLAAKTEATLDSDEALGTAVFAALEASE